MLIASGSTLSESVITLLGLALMCVGGCNYYSSMQQVANWGSGLVRTSGVLDPAEGGAELQTARGVSLQQVQSAPSRRQTQWFVENYTTLSHARFIGAFQPFQSTSGRFSSSFWCTATLSGRRNLLRHPRIPFRHDFTNFLPELDGTLNRARRPCLPTRIDHYSTFHPAAASWSW